MFLSVACPRQCRSRSLRLSFIARFWSRSGPGRSPRDTLPSRMSSNHGTRCSTAGVSSHTALVVTTFLVITWRPTSRTVHFGYLCLYSFVYRINLTVSPELLSNPGPKRSSCLSLPNNWGYKSWCTAPSSLLEWKCYDWKWLRRIKC